jgi:hypothetical protein
MGIVYTINKPYMFGRIVRWLLLFLEYEFTIVYKLSKTHMVANVLSILLNSSERLRVLDQTMDASLFSIEPMWM